jgi:hypothetical protein
VSLELWSAFTCRRSVGLKTATPGSSLAFLSLFLCLFVLTPAFSRAKTACPIFLRVRAAHTLRIAGTCPHGKECGLYARISSMRAARKLRIAGMQPAILAVRVAKVSAPILYAYSQDDVYHIYRAGCPHASHCLYSFSFSQVYHDMYPHA